ncbi:MAG TPA: ATP-grasp domain-containing protein [Syntrophales bacterium]|nr:ATP-grasp domain-containing protein [Syntrophales bacterium]
MMRKNKLLIAGGGYADIPLILSAKKLGYYVITSGNRPDELGHKYSDEYYSADFSDREAILRLAASLNVSAICACCNDFSALSSSYAAEKLGLPGHDTYNVAKIIHHKDRYREFAKKAGITTPLAKGFKRKKDALLWTETLTLPVIVKPVDLTGGKGISEIRQMDDAEKAIDSAFKISKIKRIVIEEFIVGTRHGFSVFLVDGRVVFFFSDNEHYYLNPYLVSAASVPSIVPKEVEKKLCAVAEKISSILSLKTGIFHMQYILRGDDPIIIEICRRAPGDLYIKLVEHATGIDYPSWIVRASSGLDCSGLTHSEPKGFFIRHCVMASRTGTLKNILIHSSIRNMIIDKQMWWKPGDLVTDVNTTKFGIVFIQLSSKEEMIRTAEYLPELIIAVIN